MSKDLSAILRATAFAAEPRRKLPLLIMALSWVVAPAHADLSGADPEQLCTLLSEYGIKTTGFIPEKWSNRPMCYTESEPARIENKYQFSYRVLSHQKWEIVEQLFLQLQGDPAKVLGKPPQAKFLEMAEKILSTVLAEPERQEVLMALQTLAPGEHRHAVVQGVNVQMRYVPYSPAGVETGVEFRLDLGNVCNYSPQDARGREGCIAKHRELRWSPSRF